jgi:hypothetical protein
VSRSTGSGPLVTPGTLVTQVTRMFKPDSVAGPYRPRHDLFDEKTADLLAAVLANLARVVGSITPEQLHDRPPGPVRLAYERVVGEEPRKVNGRLAGSS